MVRCIREHPYDHVLSYFGKIRCFRFSLSPFETYCSCLVMTLPDIVQQFFNLPSEDKLDEYLQQDVRYGLNNLHTVSFDLLTSADTSQSFGSSPRLTTSDNRLLDPAFWINHPTQLNTIRRLICNSEEVPQPAAKDDWLDEL